MLCVGSISQYDVGCHFVVESENSINTAGEGGARIHPGFTSSIFLSILIKCSTLASHRAQLFLPLGKGSRTQLSSEKSLCELVSPSHTH